MSYSECCYLEGLTIEVLDSDGVLVGNGNAPEIFDSIKDDCFESLADLLDQGIGYELNGVHISQFYGWEEEEGLDTTTLRNAIRSDSPDVLDPNPEGEYIWNFEVEYGSTGLSY